MFLWNTHTLEQLYRSGRGQGRKVNGIDDVAVGQICHQPVGCHPGAVVLRFGSRGAQMGDRDDAVDAQQIVGGEVGDVGRTLLTSIAATTSAELTKPPLAKFRIRTPSFILAMESLLIIFWYPESGEHGR